MLNRTEAEEHLRVIRSLMEKATIYRAISAPTALAGGVFACVATVALHQTRPEQEYEYAIPFLAIWIVVLLLTGFFNTFLLWRGSKLRGEPFLSSGMRLALIAMLPGMLCGLFFSLVLGTWPNTFWLPPIWMICYAVALLATKHFAPSSIKILGWAFLVTGMVSFYLLFAWDFWGGSAAGSSIIHFAGHVDLAGQDAGRLPVSAFAYASNMLMGLTFGLFHLIYAACTWPRKSATSESAGEG